MFKEDKPWESAGIVAREVGFEGAGAAGPSEPPLQAQKQKSFPTGADIEKGYPSSQEQSLWALQIHAEVLKSKDGDEMKTSGEQIASIFRVPRVIRDVEPEAFTPQYMKFGPLHANFTPSPEDQHKVIIARERNFQSLLEKILNMGTEQIDGQYYEKLAIDKYALDVLMANDALFIVELLRFIHTGVWNLSQTNVLALHSFIWDMILLENQIPLQLLECAISDESPSLDLLLRNFIRYWSPFKNYEFESFQLRDRKHLLDCLHFVLTTPNTKPSNAPGVKIMGARLHPMPPSASKLHHCGVKFKPYRSNVTGIHFDRKSATLRLPKLLLDDITERCFRNLAAYEACVSSRPPISVGSVASPIIEYLMLMDQLINTEEDVAVLVDNAILINHLGSNVEAAEKWNRLCKNIATSGSPHPVAYDLKAYSEIMWHTWLAVFKDQYFKKQPWLLVSIVVGVIVLISTMIQTIYTVKGFYHTS